MKLVQITFNEAEKLGLENVIIKFNEDGLNYYRPIKKVYVIRHWFNENDYQEREFDNLSDAKEYGKRFKEYELLYYKDVSFRYWEKQQVYKNGELEEEYEQ